MNELIKYLFETKAVKACAADKPFWLTSGKIGVYFINAEFLYGGEEDSVNLLKMIDEALSDHQTLPKKVFDRVLEQYNTNSIFKFVIDNMKEEILKNINIDEIDYIAGGERRDWVFSNVLAYLLNKSHITIFKDLSVLESNSDFTVTKNIENINGKNVLHVSDLITEAASYINAWIPAIQAIGGNMKWTITVVDRMQGGSENLSAKFVQTYPLVRVNKELFKTAVDNGILTQEQFDMINTYIDEPYKTMREFLLKNPQFISESLKGSGKTLVRAQKCVENDIYNLGDLLKTL